MLNYIGLGNKLLIYLDYWLFLEFTNQQIILAIHICLTTLGLRITILITCMRKYHYVYIYVHTVHF